MNFKKIIMKNKNVIYLLALLILVIIVFLIANNRNGDVPFCISEMYITSTANGEYVDDNNTANWNLSLYQNNDVYIKFGLIENMDKVNKKDAIIKEAYIDNINIVTSPYLGNISYYKLSNNENELFKYTDENLFVDKLPFSIVKENANVKENQINENGGQIALSIVNKNILTYEFEDEKELNFDGSLLKKSNIDVSQIIFKISFDINVVTKKNNTYKANVILDLPYGNILENGFELNQNVDVSQIKFELAK